MTPSLRRTALRGARKLAAEHRARNPFKAGDLAHETAFRKGQGL